MVLGPGILPNFRKKFLNKKKKNPKKLKGTGKIS